MMEAIRKGASSWIVKLLIIVPLVLAFAIWGIEDMIRGYGEGTVAQVGDREIQPEEFQTSYNNQLNMISRQFGRRLTPQQAQAIGIPAQVLSQMVNSALVEQEANNLDLTISDDDVVREIQRDPLFQDSDGNFNQSALGVLLSRAGMSEQQFLVERRRDTLRDQLTSSLLSSVHVPDTMVDLLNRYENQARAVRFISVPIGKPADIASPGADKLKEYYDQRKKDFVTPEFRKISLLEIKASDVVKTMVISDADLKALYERQKESYNTQETRRIQQIVFPNKAKAEAALAELKAGKDFIEVAKANGVKETDLDLGVQTKAQMIDQKIAEAAFALKKDETSGVIEGLSTVIVRSTEVTPGVTKTFEDVKEIVRTQLAQERVSEEIQRLHDLVDELKLAGKSPEDIAKELKIAFREIAAVDSEGLSPDGAAVIEGQDGAQVLQSAFEGEVGLESVPIERRDGGYTWVDVLEVTPKKQREFKDIQDEVLAAWQEREAGIALRKRAQAFVDRIAKGETLDAIAKEAKLELRTTEPFKRNDSPQGLPRTAVAQTFTLGLNGASAAPSADAQSRVVFQVSAITAAPDLKDDARKQRIAALKQQRQADVLQEYVTQLRSEQDVSINQPLVNRLLGLDQQ